VQAVHTTESGLALSWIVGNNNEALTVIDGRTTNLKDEMARRDGLESTRTLRCTPVLERVANKPQERAEETGDGSRTVF
jgi:hypothetical protein